MKKHLVARLALFASASGLVLAACSSEGPVGAVATLQAPNAPAFLVLGEAPEAGKLYVCIDAPPSSAVFTIGAAYTPGQSYPDGELLVPATGDFGTVADQLTASVSPTPGNCAPVLVKGNLGRNMTDLSWPKALVTVTASSSLIGTFSYTCNTNGGVGFCPNAGPAFSTTAVGGASYPHGSVVTFKFTPTTAGDPDPPIGTPVFVIGNNEARGTGVSVNFWGAQWWKNNFMTGLVDNGVASFKGYASTASNGCGGTWTSRVGNSPPPLATIPRFINVIVTSTVTKNGPNIGGNIVEILTVDTENAGYAPNPGGKSFGVVTAKLCPAAP